MRTDTPEQSPNVHKFAVSINETRMRVWTATRRPVCHGREWVKTDTLQSDATLDVDGGVFRREASGVVLYADKITVAEERQEVSD